MTIPKYVGADRELSTTGVDADGASIDPWKVTREVLASIDAALEPLGMRTWTRNSQWNQGYMNVWSTDCLRHWAPNGACYYSDMSHVEACTPSCLRPRTFAAQSVSTLLVAEAARRQAELQSDEVVRYALSASNVDVLDPSVSWGTHLSVAISTPLWEDLLVEQRHPAILGFVASALAAAIPFFGAGYLLPLKHGGTVYSLSGRAHHLSYLKTLATTQAYRRGLLNARREPHGKGQERLHLIGFDFTILSAALTCTFLQCILAAAEEGYCGMNLIDPVRSLRQWSWKMDLETGRLPAAARLVDGRELTLPEFVKELTGVLLRMCESGLITEAVAPQARELLPRILELAHYADEGSLPQCAKHLDWAAKLTCLLHICDGQSVRLGDATTRLADHDFSNTDPERGTIWRLWREGLVDPLITLGDAKRCLTHGPPESRDWGRGQIIRRFMDHVSDVDWSFVELRRDQGHWSPRFRIDLPRLDSLNKAKFQRVFKNITSIAELEQRIEQTGLTSSQDVDPLTDISSQLITTGGDEPLDN